MNMKEKENEGQQQKSTNIMYNIYFDQFKLKLISELANEALILKFIAQEKKIKEKRNRNETI